MLCSVGETDLFAECLGDDETCFQMLDNYRKHHKLVTGGQTSSKAKWTAATLKSSMVKESAVDTESHGPLMNKRRFCQWASDLSSDAFDKCWILQSWYQNCLFYLLILGQQKRAHGWKCHRGQRLRQDGTLGFK